MLPSGMQPEELLAKDPPRHGAVKKYRINDEKIWLDWISLALLVIIIVNISPYSILVNAVLSGISAIVYRFTLRDIWIHLFPDWYRIYSCPECPATVSAETKTCPQCNVRFNESEQGIFYQSNVVLFSCALIVGLMVLMLILDPDYALEYSVNIFMMYLLSVFLVFFDARRIGAGKAAAGWGKITPFWWFILMICLWIITYPLYLLKREEIFSSSIRDSREYKEFSRADVIGSFFIPGFTPVIAILPALFFAYRRKYLYSAVILSVALLSLIITTFFRGIFD